MVNDLGKPATRRAPSTGLALVGAVVALAFGPPAAAEEHIIRTRRTEWIPTVLFIQPGDSVVWQGMRTHETALIDGMGPPGAEPWRSPLDAEGFRVTLTVPGAYVYICDTHINGGMVGAIVVGDEQPSNLAAIDAALANVEIGQVFVERVIIRLKRELERRR